MKLDGAWSCQLREAALLRTHRVERAIGAPEDPLDGVLGGGRKGPVLRKPEDDGHAALVPPLRWRSVLWLWDLYRYWTEPSTTNLAMGNRHRGGGSGPGVGSQAGEPGRQIVG